MKILLSPAKSLEWERPYPKIKASEPIFGNEAQYLIQKLQKLSARQVKKLMDLSDALAELNVERYQQFSFSEKRPAIFAFDGDVYKGLDAFELSPSALERSADTLIILSGLYGILLPFDTIVPYRLEMGTSLKITEKKRNLYQFWGDSLVRELKKELKTPDELVVNAASQEYARAILGQKNNGLNLLQVEFKERKDDGYKIVSFFAKKARGMFARFVLEAGLDSKESLKDVSFDGYSFNENISDNQTFIYTRA